MEQLKKTMGNAGTEKESEAIRRCMSEMERA